MNELQWYAYLFGFISFFIGCIFYYFSIKKNIDQKQIKIRKIIMNFFLFIALICVGYSWL